MKITKNGIQVLEINSKKYDFRFELLDLRTISNEEMVCNHCPLINICDKIPDPRHFINPKIFNERYSLNDFCLTPTSALFGESIRTILANLAGKIMSEDELLEYLRRKDWIDRCLELGFLKKSGNHGFEIINFDRVELAEKEDSLSKEDKDFLSLYSDCSDELWSTMEDATDLIPIIEDIIKYTKEIVINFFKFKPFTKVSRKDTGEVGLVKERKPNGILVIFNSTNELLCNPDDLNIVNNSEDTESQYKPFDLVLCKSTGQWGVVKRSTEDEVVVSDLNLENGYSKEEISYKPNEIELI